MLVRSRLTAQEAVPYLRGLVGSDEHQVRRDIAAGQEPLAVTRGLLDGSLRYIRRDPREEWKTRNQVLAEGGGDCEDLSAAVAAELNEVFFAGGYGAEANQIPDFPRPPRPVRNAMPSEGWVPTSILPRPRFEGAPKAVPVVYKAKPHLYHVVVHVPGKGFIDPSMAGGMRKI
ncbi:hypothetical protein CMI47_17835 [Candidatus Pacearchaeota archaeon]|nr:hypothetical protein [Candidatus Pacearchaeota archaeon]